MKRSAPATDAATGAAAPRVKSIAALRRGLAVLEAVRTANGSTLHALHAATAVPKASLLRILKTLEEAGLVRRRIADGAYLACSGEPARDEDAQRRLRLTEIVAPSLRALHAQSPWPSDVAVRDDLRMLVLESNRPLGGLSVNRRVIGFHPHMLLSAHGRAYLAFCPADEREALLADLARAGDPATRAMARRREWIAQLLERTRIQGYGLRDPAHIGPDAEAVQNFCAIALPVIVGGRVVATLSCVWLPAVVPLQQVVDRYLEPLRSAAAEIGARLADDRGTGAARRGVR